MPPPQTGTPPRGQLVARGDASSSAAGSGAAVHAVPGAAGRPLYVMAAAAADPPHGGGAFRLTVLSTAPVAVARVPP